MNSSSLRTGAAPAASRRPRRPDVTRPGENPRPPRYRLLAAAAALPQREPVRPSESFERECPACGRLILFTQVHGDAGVEYTVEDHDCREGLSCRD